MTHVLNGVTPTSVSPVGLLPIRSRWVPRWWRRRQEERQLARWAAKLGWQWADTMEGTDLVHHTQTVGGIKHTVTPQVHSVDPGPPVSLLVRLLPSQDVKDFEACADHIAEGMGMPMVDIASCGSGWIKVALLDYETMNVTVPRHAYP